MMIVKNKDIVSTQAGTGVTRKILASDGGLMTVEVSFQKGAVGALHQHPHEQIGYVLKGSFHITIDGCTTLIEQGDSYYAAPNQLHGVEALEDAVLLDVFTPQREDFLK